MVLSLEVLDKDTIRSEVISWYPTLVRLCTSAGSGTRTHTVSLPTRFERVASANFATPTYQTEYEAKVFHLYDTPKLYSAFKFTNQTAYLRFEGVFT